MSDESDDKKDPPTSDDSSEIIVKKTKEKKPHASVQLRERAEAARALAIAEAGGKTAWLRSLTPAQRKDEKKREKRLLIADALRKEKEKQAQKKEDLEAQGVYAPSKKKSEFVDPTSQIKHVKDAPKLTIQQMSKLFYTPCRDRGELKAWIKFFLGLELPDCTVSRYADSNPLDIIWEIYKICVLNKNPEKVEELLVVAGRGSGKTLSVAIAELLVMFHDQRDVAHVGAILAQAKRCYEYQQNFLTNDKIRPVLEYRGSENIAVVEKMTQEKSIFNLKDRHSQEAVKVSLEVLPCTLKSVNGAHVAFVSVDEIDTLSGEGLRAFKDISGMLDSKRGRQSIRVGISTRKSRYGLMNKQIEEAQQAGRTVRKWTALEFSQRCPDERSGKRPTAAFVNTDTLECITPEVYAELDKRRKAEFEPNEFPGPKCLQCPAAALCRGDAKNQTSRSSMLKPISDMVKKVRENTPDWSISQLFNLKPSVEGIIYKEFDEKIHVQDWNGLWRILTNSEYPGQCTHDIFVKKCHSMGLPSYAGVDFGWSSPAAYVVFFVDNRENIYVVRTEARTYVNNPTWIQTIKQKWHPVYRSQLYFPDCANPGDIQQFAQEGLPVPSSQIKDINGGIQIIKKWLRSLASPVPKFYVAKDTNTFLIDEFKLYHYKTAADGTITDDPEDESDHSLDALRYAMYGLFSKSRAIVSTSTDEVEVENVVNSDGQYIKMPSPAEFAAAQGISMSDELPDMSKLGKIGKKAEDNLDDETVSPSGNFLWSF